MTSEGFASAATVAHAFLMAYKHVNTQTLDTLMNSIRWNIVVSPNTDQSVRMYLAGQGGGRKGDLSRFIEEAVRAHILELSAEQAKAANVNVSEADLTAIVAEAVQWAREH
jgi:post-segregation antitoxin (ccd killing protein)